jgi:hypothetical protein
VSRIEHAVYMLAKPHYKDFTFMKGQLHTFVLLGIRQNREVHKLVMGRAGAIVPADSFKGDARQLWRPPRPTGASRGARSVCGRSLSPQSRRR